MFPSRHGEQTTSGWNSRVRWVLVFVGMTVLGLGVVSRRVLLVASLDAISAAVVLLPPFLAGLWLVPLFRLGKLPLRWHFLLGASLGLGTTALLVLLLGLAGGLQRTTWIGLLGGFAAVGSVRLRSLLTDGAREEGARNGDKRATPRRPASGLWFVLLPFVVLAVFAASNAPGFLWGEEGYGYDVLEYHLEIPKEYLHSGRISYAPHNVYANFPMNVEMLYLLAMIVHGDVQDIGTTTNMMHLILGALAVYAVWVIGREWSPNAGRISAIAFGSVGWLGYLSGLAYVENGMLFFAATAFASLLRALSLGKRSAAATGKGALPPACGLSRRWLALAGVCSGFACGCKYTAVPMVAAAIAFAVVFWMCGGWRRRAVDLGAFLCAVAASFSPWLIKNQVMTGNPVFPLANALFRANPPGWGRAETEQWDRGHHLPEADRTLSARCLALWRDVPGDSMQRYGPAILLLAFGGLLGRRLDRTDAVLLTVLAVQVLVWLLGTHLYARFTVPFLIPLGVLAGRALSSGNSSVRQRMILGILVLGGVWNFTFAERLTAREAPGGAPASLIYDGILAGSEYFAAVNHELPEDAKILLVGDARAFYFQRSVDYCVVFNRSPFVDVVENSTEAGAVLEWLRGRGYTHVLIHWHEISRLARTYGFSSQITPELFDRLTHVGLTRLREFRHPNLDSRWVDLYGVPGKRTGG